ncbi:hypothetical protein HNQ85_000519 [Anoxybacillus calidus]|jgi:hypothetical protein|uniref:Uncharacterized protein n=1 Tax=[Anoxybacillus] calidus TaxID=575178 RepID=A0A7W0BTK4_9BACL|nr:hypothetical protein [Anoxybacillus calidus]
MKLYKKATPVPMDRLTAENKAIFYNLYKKLIVS